MNNRDRVTRQLKKVPPQAGHNIYLTLDLKLQQYVETLLAGNHAAMAVAGSYTDTALTLVSTSSYDPNLFVDSISSKDYPGLFSDPNTPLVNRVTQGVYPPVSTVKPYVVVSAPNAGVITRNTSPSDPGRQQPPGSDKRYRDWKKWGHGHLDVIKTPGEPVDTHFYQTAYNVGIDHLSEWINKFGYGHYTGTDLSEERPGNIPTREWKLGCFKKLWHQGDTAPVDIDQRYWTAIPIQTNRALMTLINDGVVKVSYLLQGTVEDGKPVPWIQPYEPPVNDIHSGYWGIVRDDMFGMASRDNGIAHKYLANASYEIAAKPGTVQVFGLKVNETYNAYRISECLCDHKLMTAFAPYDDPQVTVVMILGDDGAGPTVGITMR